MEDGTPLTFKGLLPERRQKNTKIHMSNRGDLCGQFSPRHMHTGTQGTSYGNIKLDRNEGYWG